MLDSGISVLVLYENFAVGAAILRRLNALRPANGARR